jgi:hypothetical protein
MITQEYVKKRLYYNPESGVFRWRFAGTNGVKPWDVAGCKDKKGYMRTAIKAKVVKLHRLAWLYMTGVWPEKQIDHIDGVKHNNSWANLREATGKQNSENTKLRVDNASGYRGVSWKPHMQKWCARITSQGKTFQLGYFKTAEEAAKVAAAKRAELFTHDTGRDQINFARFE